MANLRYTKEVSFNADFDLGIIETIRNGKVKVLPDVTLRQDVEIRIYVLSPNGAPFIIFDKVMYSLFVGMWGPTERFDAEWVKFPSLKLFAFCGNSCFACGDVTMKNLIFLCLELSEYSVINPCDTDGRFHDAVMAVLSKHRPKPEGADQP